MGNENYDSDQDAKDEIDNQVNRFTADGGDELSEYIKGGEGTSGNQSANKRSVNSTDKTGGDGGLLTEAHFKNVLQELENSDSDEEDEDDEGSFDGDLYK